MVKATQGWQESRQETLGPQPPTSVPPKAAYLTVPPIVEGSQDSPHKSLFGLSSWTRSQFYAREGNTVVQDEADLKGKTRLVLWGAEETWRWWVRMTLQLGQRASISNARGTAAVPTACLDVGENAAFLPAGRDKESGRGVDRQPLTVTLVWISSQQDQAAEQAAGI